MIYAGKQIMSEYTVEVTSNQKIKTHHFIGSDRNRISFLGRGPTRIRCTLRVPDEDLRDVEGLLRKAEPSTLIYDNKEYRDVVAEGDYRISPVGYRRDVWRIDVTFQVLDPTPRHVDTGEAIY